nr:retrovirus-related Pol polyprotein from transposon TNT 1-94 [Tanacetum cinerariifolium]
MIGSLMYLTATRLDIQFSIVLCARYQSNPKESHLIAMKRNLSLNTLDNTDQGLEYLTVKYINDPIIPLYEVSLTSLPDRSGPKLFGGTMGVFTKELSKMSYFLSRFLVYYS